MAIRWYLSTEVHENADAVLERMLREPELFAVPELFLFEVHAVLWRIHPAPQTAYSEGFLPVVESGVLRYPMTAGLAANAAAFLQLGLAGYDACNASLARELAGVWLTFDAAAHRQITQQGISVCLAEALPEDW